MISIITLTYNSSNYINNFVKEIKIELVKNKISDYEIIIVDDGSTDSTSEKLYNLSLQDKNIKIILLSTNFGQPNALLAGLKYACGDFIFITDADLEIPADTFSIFFEILSKDEKIDLVYGKVKNQADKYIFSRVFSAIFHFIIYFLAGNKNTKYRSTTTMFKKKVLFNFLKFQERDFWIAGVFDSLGFNQLPIEVDRKFKGYSSYTFKKKLFLSLDIITNSSKNIFYYIPFFFLLFFIISIIFSFFILGLYFFKNFSSELILLNIMIFIMLSFLLFSQGMLMLYIYKIYNEVRKRPNYIVKEKYNFHSNNS